jgi:hypothetical protein
MASDVIPTPDQQRPIPVNGTPRDESVMDRAKRILGGDIRPDDYLTLPTDAAAKVEWEFATALQLRPGAVLTETEKLRIRQNRALEYHYGGRWVEALRTPEGVIALATGEDIGLIDTLPSELRRGVVSEFQLPWDCL